MIVPKLVGNDIEIEGEMKLGDKVPNLCCQGFDWVVSGVHVDVWGICQNPDCPICNQDMTTDDDQYKGISYRDEEAIAEHILVQSGALV